MRSGETDKAVSVYNDRIYNLITKLNNIVGIKGAIDIDIFITNDNKLYINEINPRFGGGYNHAHHAGCNYVKYTVLNMLDISNDVKIKYHYKKDFVMLKYNNFLFKDLDDKDIYNS